MVSGTKKRVKKNEKAMNPDQTKQILGPRLAPPDWTTMGTTKALREERNERVRIQGRDQPDDNQCDVKLNLHDSVHSPVGSSSDGDTLGRESGRESLSANNPLQKKRTFVSQSIHAANITIRLNEWWSLTTTGPQVMAKPAMKMHEKAMRTLPAVSSPGMAVPMAPTMI